MTPREKTELEIPIPDESSLPRMFEAQEKRDSLELLITLAKHKSFIIGSVAGTAVLSIVISLLLPVYYTAETKIMPPQQKQSFASAMLDQLGGLGSLIGAGGGGGLLGNPSDLYVDMLHSAAIEDDLIDRFALIQLYKKKLRIDARHALEDATLIKANKDGVISISVDDRDARRAADIANAYVDELEKLTKRLAVTDAGKRRIFFEREVKTATEQLENAEQELKRTEEVTGIIQMDSQSRFMLQAYADLRAQAAEKAVEIESMRSFATPENPEVVRLGHELDALRTQIAGIEKGQGGSPVGDIALERVPEKALKYYDKMREVTYRSSLLQLLLKQYEIARIDEGKDASLIQFLDRAGPPERKSRPKRAIIVFFATLLALLLAALYAYFRERLDRAKGDPSYLAQLQLLKFHLSAPAPRTPKRDMQAAQGEHHI
jgi:uncharacterized protein involved in exopolysaccharide biosynthesis